MIWRRKGIADRWNTKIEAKLKTIISHGGVPREQSQTCELDCAGTVVVRRRCLKLFLLEDNLGRHVLFFHIRSICVSRSGRWIGESKHVGSPSGPTIVPSSPFLTLPGNPSKSLCPSHLLYGCSWRPRQVAQTTPRGSAPDRKISVWSFLVRLPLSRGCLSACPR
jgi:hypothetical protein